LGLSVRNVTPAHIASRLREQARRLPSLLAISTIFVLSFCTISLGVPAGAKMANQIGTSESG